MAGRDPVMIPHTHILRGVTLPIVNVCHGRCHDMGTRQPQRYDGVWKHCVRCGTYLRVEGYGIRCPCCSGLMRCSRRSRRRSGAESKVGDHSVGDTIPTRMTPYP